jgi:hypothetical protein
VKEERMIPSVGRIVHLRLSEQCAVEINRRRVDAQRSEVAATKSGAQVHVGNSASEGDVLPLLICKVWSAEPTEQTAVNGQVFLDGNDVLWATSVAQGDASGQWHEPERV